MQLIGLLGCKVSVFITHFSRKQSGNNFSTPSTSSTLKKGLNIDGSSQFLSSQDLYLHCYSFEDGIFLNCLYVINSKTNQKVHDDDRHHYDKDNKQPFSGVHVRYSWDPVVVLIIKEQVIILHLPSCHYQGFDH